MLNIINILVTQYIMQYCVTVGRSKLEESKAMHGIVCGTFGNECRHVPRQEASGFLGFARRSMLLVYSCKGSFCTNLKGEARIA